VRQGRFIFFICFRRPGEDTIERMDKLWDYTVNRNVKPADKAGQIWYLERKINYDDWRGLDLKAVRRHFRKMKIDPAKRVLLKTFFKYYEGKI
jgi:hypothetical protein